MDLITLSGRLLASMQNSNGTSNGTLPDSNVMTDLPIKLLETFIPGYSLASRLLLSYLGIDISLYVTVIVFLYALNRARLFLWRKIEHQFRYYLTSKVHIDGNDDLRELVVQWIAATRPDISARWATARTGVGSAHGSDGDDSQAFMHAALDEQGNFNFSRWEAKVPPRYEPAQWEKWFKHPGVGLFLITTTFKIRPSNDPRRLDQEFEELDIHCVGRSIEPIKKLLAEIKLWAINKQVSRTAIRSANAMDHGYWRQPWSKTSERPCRPMDTVILDPEQKERVQKDMNEFLHPLSASWYATRGIPYRRGYLFHGPPGTGKTSLSFALAGMFGLDIYIVPLMDPELSESFLSILFNKLPKRCIVLLEDIDTAGVAPRVESDDEEDVDDDEDEAVADETSRVTAATGAQGAEPNDIKRLENGVAHDTVDANSVTSYSKPDAADAAPDVPNGVTTASPAQDSNSVTTVAKAQHPKHKGASKGQTDSSIDKAQGETDPHKVTLNDLAAVMLSMSDPYSSPYSFSYGKKGLRRRKNKRRDPLLPDPNEPKSNISLSGLLNVIDGIATHEGRMLIMTTNHPEKLDSALVRAGRVDMQVRFAFATKSQMKHIFLRMYVGDVDAHKTHDNAYMREEAQALLKRQGGDTRIPELGRSGADPCSGEELEEIATRFSEALPEDTFAPSAVQGYLLMHKKAPREALAGVGKWKEEKERETRERAEAKEKGGRKGVKKRGPASQRAR